MNHEQYQTIHYPDIGKRVRAARKNKKLTQQALAEQVDLTPSNISHIERGTTKLSIQSLIRIANALEVSVDQLLCDNLEYAPAPLQQEISDLLSDCTQMEIRILTEILQATKRTLRKNME